MDASGIDAETLACGQRFTGQLQKNSFEDGFCHMSGSACKILGSPVSPDTLQAADNTWNPELFYFAASSPSAFGAVNATVMFASPTLKRAKRRTVMFSPSLPIFAAISCEMEI